MTSSIITFLPESELCNTDVPQHNSRYYLNLIYAVSYHLLKFKFV